MKDSRGYLRLRVLFTTTIFFSSYLLFLIQPLLSKFILPWYGGTPAVWTTSLLFFQTFLFLGYAYAHLVQRFPVRLQSLLHLGLFLIALVMLPVIPALRWQPHGNENPLGAILVLLTFTVGLPYLALAGTGPLLQVWFARLAERNSPYRLFAASSAGSLLALLSYPFLVEPWLSSPQQGKLWSWLFVLLVLPMAVCAWMAAKQPRSSPLPESPADGSESPPPRSGSVLMWVGWSAAGVIIMMAVSLQLCQNIATIPFLWVVPLAIYLLSFIITFSGERYYHRRWLTGGLVASLVVLYLVIPGRISWGNEVLIGIGLWSQITLFSVALLVITLVCHGELYRLRPAPRYLTRFYLAVAGGGALGGVFVGWAAPGFLGNAHELYLGLVLVVLLLLATHFRDIGSPLHRGRPFWAWATLAMLVVGLMTAFSYQAASLAGEALFARRNFFGNVSVTLHDKEMLSYSRLVMRHGVTKHGAQYLRGTYRRLPVTYYSPLTGVGLAITAYGTSLGVDQPMHVGVVGLGVGTLAAYGRPGDRYRFYEINPAVVELAQISLAENDSTLRFSYLADCQAEFSIVSGDARLQLTRELEELPTGHGFDVLVLDAFESGAIPLHLLTREAFALYAAHLNPTGVLAIHISNKYLDLSGVVHRLAGTQEFRTVLMTNRRRDFREQPELDCDVSDRSEWMILYRDPTFAEKLLEISQPLAAADELEVVPGHTLGGQQGRVWTDTACNLLEALR